MATTSVAITQTETHGDHAHSVLWEEMGDADQGEAITLEGSQRLSVQVIGTFGSATVVLQGSNDGTNWVTLQDLDSAAISLTAAGLVGILEQTRYVRPSTSGGTGTDVDVYLFLRKTNIK